MNFVIHLFENEYTPVAVYTERSALLRRDDRQRVGGITNGLRAFNVIAPNVPFQPLRTELLNHDLPARNRRAVHDVVAHVLDQRAERSAVTESPPLITEGGFVRVDRLLGVVVDEIDAPVAQLQASVAVGWLESAGLGGRVPAIHAAVPEEAPAVAGDNLDKRVCVFKPCLFLGLFHVILLNRRAEPGAQAGPSASGRPLSSALGNSNAGQVSCL